MVPVLVIDDEPSIRRLVCEALTLEEHPVRTAINGADGLRVMRELPEPHVVLAGHMMPVMTGAAMLHEVAQDPVLAEHHVYIPMTVTHNIPYMLEELKRFARRPYLTLTLPFTYTQLIRVVHEANGQLKARAN
ncbi:MAG TPA: response regulator [Ktedonobacterales bacterium]